MATALQNSASGFRKTSAGVKLGRALFDPSVSIGPTQIAQLLKQAGLPIPKEAMITADVAQIIMAGGALVNNVETAADVGAYVAPSANIMKAGLDVFELTGIIDPKSPGAQIVNFGTDLALVVSSGGLNVLADIAFIFDLIGAIFSPDDRPKVRADLTRQAAQKAIAQYNQRESAQATAAAQQFSDYHNGKLSVFQFLGGVAQVAPDLFLNYFPDMKTFIPPILTSITASATGQASYGGFLGIGRSTTTITQYYTFWFNTINNDKTTLQTAFVNKYILDPYTPYRKIGTMSLSDMKTYGYPKNAKKIGVFDHSNPVYPRMHLTDIAILSMMPPYFEFLHDDFDVKKFLTALMLTPSDLGYTDFLETQMYRGDFGGLVPLQDPTISINGQNYYNQQDFQSNKIAQEKDVEMHLAVELDRLGDITNLLKIPRAERAITEWGIMPYLPGTMEPQLPQSYKNLPISDPMGYRNIRNYWSAVAMASFMQKDPYFQNFNISSLLSDFLATQSDLDSRMRQIQFKSVARHLNSQAKQNIASFFGIPVSKLKLSPIKEGERAYVLN